ncbi:uncharacterized protein LOC115627604 [Scaptodrosophila lebanonensis]|uniref:Uncharacterized protein LOC115627604 n=1 Tax=Drosophila lebanonensis TaxID=7225 RepID=A0A6J2TRA2_DROLE|nr:uncharacterized protein LOC115627604 [Scaptodrosophila lebanonensis]
MSGVQPGKMPWQNFDWPPEQQRIIYRSWGQYFSRLRMNAQAQKYFNSCIDSRDSGDYRTLYLRSKFHRTVARGEDALLDIERAAAMPGVRETELNLELADVMYTMNRFEDNKMMLHDNVVKHIGSSMEPFKKRLAIVNENFRDNLGPALGPFFLKSVFGNNTYNLPKSKIVDDRPHWKILKEEGECDVQSVVDKEEITFSPLEGARRRRMSKIFYQKYLDRAWVDIIFMNALRKSPVLFLDQCTPKYTKRAESLNRSYERVRQLTSMLHRRSPMYNEVYQQQRDPKLMTQFKEANLFRVQYQTRRNLLSILRTIRSLRVRGESKRLRDFVRDLMGEYVVLKTGRVLPWKFEFVNEVYNNLALSLCQEYRLPTKKVTPYNKNALCQLLNMHILKPAEFQEFVFGNRATYDEGDGGKPEQKMHKRFIAQLEQRLSFANHHIERAYLLHELSERHLLQNHFMQSLSFAKRAIEEARRCNSVIWEFLCTMLLAKSHAVLHKYERQTEVLNAAYNLAKRLKSPQLCTFIELCRMLNKDYITLRKMSQLEAGKRLRHKLFNRGSSPSPSTRSLMRERQSIDKEVAARSSDANADSNAEQTLRHWTYSDLQS